MKKLFVFTTYGAHKIRIMRQWECGSVCPCAPASLILFSPQPRRLPGYIRRTSASAHTSGPDGRALHAATSPFTGIRQCALKAKELTVERHYTRLSERLSTGKSKMPACHGGGSGCSYDLPRMLGRSHPWKPDACVGR